MEAGQGKINNQLFTERCFCCGIDFSNEALYIFEEQLAELKMDEIIQLKAVIKHSKPTIWRRILVSKDTTLFKLHHILQIAFGWQNYHAFQFAHQGYVFVNADVINFREESENVLDTDSTSLDALIVEEGEQLDYLYDLGDHWEHLIEVEKLLPLKAKKQYPVCTAGRNACPPEDCGGITSYYHLLKVLKDPKHPQYRDIRKWIGKKFSPKEFDLERVNEQLRNIDGYINEWLKP